MYKQLRFLTTMLLLAVCCGTWAEDYSEWPCSTTPLTTEGTKIDGITWKISSANTYSNPIRFYANTTITLTADADVVDHITKVVFQASSTGNYVTNLTNGTAKFDGTTVSGSANGKLVTWTPTTGSKPSEFTITVNTQTRMSDMTVYYVRKSTSNVQIPEFSPSAGEVEYGTSVSIIQVNAHLIKYTLDESEPTWDNGKDIDTNPITITQDVTIKARAFDSNQNASDVVTAVYTVKRPDAPTFNPAAGAVEEGTTVTISGRPTGGKIIYTTDGTDPSYSNNIGTVYVDGDVITVNQAMTIKAIAVDEHYFESSVASASYTIYDPNVPGTQNNPYTVAQALDASASTGVYVRGIISRIYSTSVTNNGQIRYYISDDGTTEKEMNIYNGKGLNGAAFTSIDDIQVGDVVVIFGDISVYQNANQMAANNYIVSLQRKQVASIALSGTYPTTFVEGSTFSHEGIVVTATYDDNSTVDVTERATFSEPDMTQVGEQTVTVTYQEKTATYTITITEKPKHTATFMVEGLTNSTTQIKEGEAIVFPTINERYGYTLVGWTTTTINGTQPTAPEMVTNATMGTADVTYYAVFAKGSSSSEPASATISYETEGVPESYGTANEFSECTLDGIKFMIQQMYKNGEKLQWRANGNSNGTGTMYNVDAINKIQSIVLTYDSSDSNKNFTVNVGNSANPTEGTSIEPTSNGNVYTFDCSANNVNYFVLANGTYAGYLTSIVINYLNETSNYADYCTTIPRTLTVAPSTVEVAGAGGAQELEATYTNFAAEDLNELATFMWYASETATSTMAKDPNYSWVKSMSFDIDTRKLTFTVDANETGAARTAYFKLRLVANGNSFSGEVHSNMITITQAAIPTATITLNAACTDGEMVYGTYSNTSAFVVSDDIVVAEVGIVDGKLWVEEYETGAVVPANTGVMVSALEGGNYTVTLTDEEGTSVLGTDNNLRPTGAEGINATDMAAAEDVDCLYYRLTMHNGETIGFWWGAEDGAAFAVAANKAYLAVSVNQAKAGFAFEGGEATSISTIDNGQLTMDNAYNLQGQKVGSEYKGIVIVNGKKVMVK